MQLSCAQFEQRKATQKPDGTVEFEGRKDGAYTTRKGAALRQTGGTHSPVKPKDQIKPARDAPTSAAGAGRRHCKATLNDLGLIMAPGRSTRRPADSKHPSCLQEGQERGNHRPLSHTLINGAANPGNHWQAHGQQENHQEWSARIHRAEVTPDQPDTVL